MGAIPLQDEPLSMRLGRLQPGQCEVLTPQQFDADFPSYLSLVAQLKAAVALANAAGCSVEFIGTDDVVVAICRTLCPRRIV